MNIFKQLWDNFINREEKILEDSDYFPKNYEEFYKGITYNDMYPYTVEKTIRVTHHSKPLRRDPSRRHNKIKNYRF